LKNAISSLPLELYEDAGPLYGLVWPMRLALSAKAAVKARGDPRRAARHDSPQQDGPGRVGDEGAILRGCRLRPVEALQAWLTAAEINAGPVSARC
jgi:hypothetical protein